FTCGVRFDSLVYGWMLVFVFLLFYDTATTVIFTLSLHDALPIYRCGRSRHLARKLSLRRKRSSPNVAEMAATETITSIILKTFRSEERFSRNAETELVCRLLLEKKSRRRHTGRTRWSRPPPTHTS